MIEKQLVGLFSFVFILFVNNKDFLCKKVVCILSGEGLVCFDDRKREDGVVVVVGEMAN